MRLLKYWLLLSFVSLVLVLPVFEYSLKSSYTPSDFFGIVLGTQSKEEVEVRRFNEARVIKADNYLTHTPNPIEKIQLEGKLASDPVMKKSYESLQDENKMFDLSYAYTITKEPKYLDKAEEFFLAWATTNKSVGNPIDDTHLEITLNAYSLVRDSLPDDSRSKVDAWLVSIANAEINTTQLMGGRLTNNWNSHRIKVVSMIGYILDNQAFLDFSVEEYKKHIENNLNPDGTSFDFVERDAIHYHLFNLDPLLVVAQVASLKGLDLYSYEASDGASLRKSVEFVLPYLAGDQVHYEFVDSTVAFDRARASAGQKEYSSGNQFEPKNGIKTLELIYFFDPRAVEIIRDIKETKDTFPTFNSFLIHSKARNFSPFYGVL